MTTKIETRKCRLCNETKALDLFEKDNRVKGGRTNRCRECKHGLDDRASRLYRTLRRRAKENDQLLEVTRKELRALFAAFDGECIYCGISEDETGTPHHVDHYIPVSEGGRHHKSNLVLSCASCNASKGNEPFLAFYIRRRDEISDENFNTLVYYLSLTGERPVTETLVDLVADYNVYAYEHLSDMFDDDELRELAREAVKQKIKTEGK